jgi:hypothetical protein
MSIIRYLAPYLLRNAGPGVASGECNGRSKLTAADIPEIRRRAAIEPLADIAADFGVSPATIGNIANRRTWAHVPD